MKTYVRKLSTLLSGPTLLTFSLPVLMIYLVVGTIAQKYIGLYEATHMFFSDLIFWLGPLPLPGLPVFMALIFVNLSFKLLFKSPWVISNSGIIITHIGAALLLVGGMFTALFSAEHYMDLSKNQPTGLMSDYHVREFVMLDEDERVIERFSHADLQRGDRLMLLGGALSVEILERCRNCKITARENADESFIGMAQHMQLSDEKPEHQNEENMAGLSFAVETDEARSVFVALEHIPRFPEIEHDGRAYHFTIRKVQSTLPFTIELIEFQKNLHPGTAMAKAYSSRVRIKDGDAQWESMISMNEPLRYKGYTFFQSSFIETPQGTASVLAVVWNAGRAFPYISGIAMCMGIIVHLFMRRRQGKTKGRAANA